MLRLSTKRREATNPGGEGCTGLWKAGTSGVVHDAEARDQRQALPLLEDYDDFLHADFASRADCRDDTVRCIIVLDDLGSEGLSCSICQRAAAMEEKAQYLCIVSRCELRWQGGFLVQVLASQWRWDGWCAFFRTGRQQVRAFMCVVGWLVALCAALCLGTK